MSQAKCLTLHLLINPSELIPFAFPILTLVTSSWLSNPTALIIVIISC